MSHVLHINDNNLLIQNGERLSRSQGYAWLKGEHVIFDTDADTAPVNVCRLSPQEINSRYWQQCEASSIAKNGAGMRHAADLVWRHLSDLKAQHSLDEVVLVVPSHYQSSNLQLLLGIAKSCGLQVTGLINKAVASLHNTARSDGDYVHLDVQLHQTVSSQITVANGIAKLGVVEVVQGVGIQAMQDALLKALQENFIRNDRFDPLHYAETEQQLFDQLSDVAQQIEQSGKASVGVEHQSRLHRSSIDLKLWERTLSPFAQQLLGVADHYAHAYVDMNAAFDNTAVSGLNIARVSVLAAHPNLSPTLLSSAAAQEGSPLVYRTDLPSVVAKQKPSSHKEPQIPTESLAHNGSAKPVSSPHAKETDPTGATHLLQAGIAVPVEHAELRTKNGLLTLHAKPEGNAQALLTAGKVFILNDESRQRIEPNDRLGSHLADGVITVIQVV